MRKVILFFIASLFITLTACNKEKINVNKVNPSDISVITDKAELQKRITIYNQPYSFNTLKSTSAIGFTLVAKVEPNISTRVYHYMKTEITSGAQSWFNTTNSTFTPDPLFSYTPLATAYTEIDGGDFSITGAAILGDKAYFTSHINGAGIGGEVLVVSASSLETWPTLTPEFSIFDFAGDYNDLTIDQAAEQKLWVAGDNKKGAMLKSVLLSTLNALDNDTALIAYSPLEDFSTTPALSTYGASGNSVRVLGDGLWFVAGGSDKGSLTMYNRNTNALIGASAPVKYAKHFDIGENTNGSSAYYGAFLFDDIGYFGDHLSKLRIFTYTPSDPLVLVADYTLHADVTYVGKNAIDIDGEQGTTQFVYCAMGGDGIIKVAINAGNYAKDYIDYADDTHTAGSAYIAGTVIDSYQLSKFAPLDGTGLANSLVVTSHYVFVAYGASGLLVFDKSDLAAGPIGSWNDDTKVKGSCNYVSIDDNGTTVDLTDDVLWVGFGTGGMLMFSMTSI